MIGLEYYAEQVCAFYMIDVGELKSKSQVPEFVEPRHMFFYIAKKYTDATLQQIGKFCGDRHHTTVMHGIKKVNDLQMYEDVKEDIHKLEFIIEESCITIPQI